MVEKKIISIVLVCVALAVGLIGTTMALDQKDKEQKIKIDQISGLENEKIKLEAQFSTIQSEKAILETQASNLQCETTSLNNKKNALETQFSSLQSETTVLENEKSTLESQVSDLQGNVSRLQSEVSSLESDKLSLETQVSKLQADVMSLENEVIQSFSSGYADGKSDGYQLGYDDGYVQGTEEMSGSGWYLRDPTYDEAIVFINSDTTDQNEWTPTYVCYDFTADFNYNALQAGYRCGFVYIEFDDGAHAITCFNTTDRGLIYIEPQTDEIVSIAIGQLYDVYIIERLGIIW